MNTPFRLAVTAASRRSAATLGCRRQAQRALFTPSSSSTARSFATNSSKMAATQIPKDYNSCLYTPLSEADPEVYKIIQNETYRQFCGLELIASENLTSAAVMECNGSFLTNKYSEGLPGARYYGGNEYIDQLEILCQERAAKAFHVDPKVWAVNVQPYSGSTANFAVFTALIEPQDKIMGLGLPDGGHLTHGFVTAKGVKISASSKYFTSQPYKVDPKTGLIDYDGMEKAVAEFKPRILICGASAYPRDWDYARLRKIADSVGAYLMADIAHISGLVAAQVQNDPFEYCDVVTTTTHKSLRGSRAAMAWGNKERNPGIDKRINDAVFPACQGGPHNNTIAGIAVALKQAADPAFKEYAMQVIKNSRALAKALIGYGYKLQTEGSDNHLVLWDLRPIGLTGSKVENLADRAHVTVNKNAVVGDTSAQVPGGIRIGTSALTSRSMNEPEMEKVAEFLHRIVQLSLAVQERAGSKLLKDFLKVAEEGELKQQLDDIAKDVKEFATSFPLPGITDTSKLVAP